jgi:hypothetical protein
MVLIILSKSLTPNIRRIFPAELKGQVQKGLPRLASTACFLETNDFSTIPCHCFYTVFMITRKGQSCQGEWGKSSYFIGMFLEEKGCIDTCLARSFWLW